MDLNDLRMSLKAALDNLWARIQTMFSGLDERVTDLEEGGGGGGGSDTILATSTAFPIPASGSSVSYSMAGLTAEHQLVRWNFSASAENAPPADLTCTTYAGYFTVTNTGGTTSESMQPVFALPQAVAITSR